MGDECKAKGAHVILGPTINIQRSPLGGRGFESYSEDPLLSGKMASGYVRGVQAKGVSACLKHFVSVFPAAPRPLTQARGLFRRSFRELIVVDWWCLFSCSSF